MSGNAFKTEFEHHSARLQRAQHGVLMRAAPPLPDPTMTDENTPKPDNTVETPSPLAAPSSQSVESAEHATSTRLEVHEATELSGNAEAAEVIPPAELLQDVVAEAQTPSVEEPVSNAMPQPVPATDEPAPVESAERIPVSVLVPEPLPEQEPVHAATLQDSSPEPVAAEQPADLTASSPTTEATPAVTPTQVESAPAAASSEPAPPPAPTKKTRKSTKAASVTPEPVPVATEPVEPAPTVQETSEPPAENKKKWYVVKIQSGREESIKAAIERKVKIEGLEEYFGQIVIPVEEYHEVKKVTELKNGERVTKEKKVLKHRKKFPGYLFAEVEFNDRILYLFRETSGVGDFVGASQHRAPTPMTDKEVQSMLTGVIDKDAKRKTPTKQVVKLEFEKGDKVKIRDGPFANMEGEVKAITEAKEAGETPKVTVEVTIFGRGVPVELDYWHVDKV